MGTIFDYYHIQFFKFFIWDAMDYHQKDDIYIHGNATVSPENLPDSPENDDSCVKGSASIFLKKVDDCNYIESANRKCGRFGSPATCTHLSGILNLLSAHLDKSVILYTFIQLLLKQHQTLWTVLLLFSKLNLFFLLFSFQSLMAGVYHHSDQ